MFDSCLMSAKSMKKNPKRKKGEKNVLTHAFFLRLNRTPILPHSQSVIIALKLYPHDVRKSVSLTALKRGVVVVLFFRLDDNRVVLVNARLLLFRFESEREC